MVGEHEPNTSHIAMRAAANSGTWECAKFSENKNNYFYFGGVKVI